MNSMFVDIDGRLYLVHDGADKALPTGLRSAEWSYLVGRRCEYLGDGIVELEGGPAIIFDPEVDQ
ncbi:hypothetical protein [Desulfosoma caldarium]|uniref:Uncharacterized protein n=1 Tax=Desulfosoma caldarium TaxID=610254 RepID=A0A3N1VQN0_9BACT|nr:hypothetical protein [Desulfosoma caldarium]ROR03381.1 hypothetical protein EDC27_0117 [Desulfosoma caldarium]